MEGGSRLLFVLFFADDRMDAESAEHISIVVDVGAIEAAAQLHRDVVVGVGQAFDAQQRCPGLYAQPLAIVGVRGHGLEFFFGAHHAHAELGFEEGVHRRIGPGQAFEGQALECVARKPQVFEDRGLLRKCERAAHVDHGIARAQAQGCLLYTSPSPRDKRQSRMPSSA